MEAPVVVSMVGITKRFGELCALDSANLDLRRGEVHALLGENGAGKTTLMNVLYGLYQLDEGKIIIDGKEVSIQNPGDALSHGIGMVHQHFRLISNFTAFENIVLGTGKGLKFDEAALKEEVTKIARDYNLGIELDAKVKSLAVGSQQRVEILKVLTRSPKVLILDEPTSSLTPQEVDALLAAVKKFAQGGLAVVFITHKVKEVMAIADRITILRGGKNVATVEVKGISEAKLVELMMGGSESVAASRGDAGRSQGRGVVLAVKDLVVFGDEKLRAVDGLNLSLYSGEILGLAGISGNGQRELSEAIMGIRKSESGSISLDGEETTGLNCKKLIARGVRYIPEDRMADGLLPTMSVAENLMLSHQRSSPFVKAYSVDYGQVAKRSREVVREYDVKTPGISTHAGRLSGGNIQKVQIGRALIEDSKVLIAHNPTRGLDIATTNLVLRKLAELKAKGTGVILISEDLDELMQVSDRLGVICKGRITGVLAPSEYDRYKIGALMVGEQEMTH